MNNTNFTAQELTTLQGSAENLFKEIVESIKAVRDACQHMSGVVKSEDSGLATAWDNVAQAILDPVTKAESSLDTVGKALKSYVDQTVSNEQNAESELGSIDEELEALGKIASGIVDLGSVIGGAAAGGAAGGAAGAVGQAVAHEATTAGQGIIKGIGQTVANGAAGGAKDPGSIPGNGIVVGGGGGSVTPPSVIYAPPTPSTPTVVGGGGGSVTPPSVIYAPPTPSAPTVVGGGGSSVTPPSVIYAPPTPKAPIEVTK